MFTGIVTHTGTVARVQPLRDARRIHIHTPDGFTADVRTGDSIAIDGVCLGGATADYTGEAPDAGAEGAAGEGLPPPRENPMSADRVRWEHIQRVFEQCNRNVSETARRLNMHRRTLQRILNKRAPRE